MRWLNTRPPGVWLVVYVAGLFVLMGGRPGRRLVEGQGLKRPATTEDVGSLAGHGPRRAAR